MQSSSWAGALTALTISVFLISGATGARANAIDDNADCYEQFRGGEMKLAIYYCSRAIQSGELETGDMVVALLNRGVAHKNSGNVEMAIIDYTSALELAPDDALLYSNRANAYREVGKTAEALQDINRAIELNSDNPAAFYVRGLLFEMVSDGESARRDFLRAHELDPENVEFRDNS